MKETAMSPKALSKNSRFKRGRLHYAETCEQAFRTGDPPDNIGR